jgi:TOMM system kinase/cyclase fusion protein
MTFDEVLEQIRELLQSKGRVAYRALKRRFELDDEYLEDLKAELIDAEHVAHDEDGKVLVWTGSTPVVSASQPLAPQPADSASRTLNSPSSQTPGAQREAERRQLTVMFCDLVGSTALSEQLDPEELREVVSVYHETCAGAISRYGGHTAQHLGDGLLVYFGYPAAHEDAAQRAVRTGLEILAELSSLNARLPSTLKVRLPHPVQVRIGVHTGLVVIGEIGSSEKREILALGETPNIAARLQGLAEPDTLVISTATQRLVTGLFEYQDLGPQTLKGISTPLSVYQVVGESEMQSRFEAAVRTGLTPLVGREEELGLLRRRWEQAKAGEGQVVLLNGEAGIGKSRLMQTLKEQAITEGAIHIEFRCSPYHQNSAFYPIIEHLQRLLQFERGDPLQTKLTKLQQTLATYRFPQAETLPLLATLLSLPQPEGAPPLMLSPQRQKQLTQEALVAWLIEDAERTAVSCAWEDLHWADPSSLEVLSLVLDQVPTTRLLVLLTFRPDFLPPWRPRSPITQLTLNRLGRSQVEAMVERVTGGKALPAEVMQQIVRKTDGVPLFVEELTKMVLESGLLRDANGHYELTGPLPSLAIPSTLQDSLMARLDRLAPVREVAQLGAILGREFSYELLRAISPLAEGTLQQGLRQLVEAELIYQRGLPPQATYLFKHALVQDTAYHSLLKSTRQQSHRQVAQVLEARFAETVDTQPELVAHHYTEAGLVEQAIPYWQKAGQRATQQSAYVEAIRHLRRGLELLKLVPDTPERARHELTLQAALGAPLQATKGWAAPEVEQAYTRARELCQQVDETQGLFPILWGLFLFYIVRAELQPGRELGEQLHNLAQSIQDPVLVLEAHLATGTLLFHLGELIPAREHLEQGIALYNLQQHRSLAFLYGTDPGVHCLSYASWVLWVLGYPAQALKRSQEALALAQELSHPFILAFSLDYAATFHQFRRERQTTQEQAAAAITLCAEQRFVYYLTCGSVLQGWALAEQGQGEEGVAQIHQGVAAFRAMGAGIRQPLYLALLAEACGKVGQAEEGLSALSEALMLVNKTGQCWYEAELYRLKGELTLKQFGVRSSEFGLPNPQHPTPSPQAEAEACFQKAIEVARGQSAKSWELRAVMSLSRLWQQQGKKAEAWQLLAEIYGWFTEGFDTKDLQDAKRLIEELS